MSEEDFGVAAADYWNAQVTALYLLLLFLRVWCPISRDNQEPVPVHEPLVLIVDDDPELRAYLRRSLTLLPARVLEAVDGAAALTLARDAELPALDLVISDIAMPIMDGWALKAALHDDPMLTDVPVLLITGEPVQLRDGPVLRKPFNTRRLHACVRALLPAA